MNIQRKQKKAYLLKKGMAFSPKAQIKLSKNSFPFEMGCSVIIERRKA